MAASSEITDGDHSVELIVRDTSPSLTNGINGDGNGVGEEITPLLSQAEKPKINIFSVAYSRRRPREQVIKLVEADVSPLSQFILWVWGGSRYSGLLCVVLSSTIYFVMEVLLDSFSAQSIPLLETAFARCTIVFILSYLWLKRGGQPIFGPAHARKFLFFRALVGLLSLLSFIYCIQRLPLSQAVVLSLTTPIMAAIVARVFFREKLKISDIGGLACSFSGGLVMFRQILTTQGAWDRAGEANIPIFEGYHHVYAVLVGLFSSAVGGICYCLIRAGAMASDQPVTTVFAFGVLASPAAGICTFTFEEFVMPNVYSFLLMLVLGVLAFFVEVLLARGLQLEKTSKAANVVYIEVCWRDDVSFSSLFNVYSPALENIKSDVMMFIKLAKKMQLGFQGFEEATALSIKPKERVWITGSSIRRLDKGFVSHISYMKYSPSSTERLKLRPTSHPFVLL